MMETVENKVVLITGGAGTIATAMITELLNLNVKGVVIVDKAERNCHSGTTKTIFIKADVTIPEELEGAFIKTIQTYNQLDIVINNAGLMEEVDWKSTVAVNFTSLTESTYLAMKKYLPKYKSGDEGLIINIASDLGLFTVDFLPVYCATKHAVVALGRCLGSEEFYQTYQVKILTICPGPVNTPLITTINEKKFEFPEKMRAHLKKIRGCIQSPVHVAKALVDVIKKGRNGSSWVVHNGVAPYEVAEAGIKKI